MSDSQSSNDISNKWMKNIGDKDVSNELINIEHFMLKDLMQSFIYTEDINTIKQRNSDLPKFQYSFIKGDNFTSKFNGGCPNCGSPFDFLYLSDIINGSRIDNSLKKTSSHDLRCMICDYSFLKLLNSNFSDSIINTRKGKLENSGSSSIYITGIRKSLHFGSTGKWWTRLNNTKNSIEEKKNSKRNNKSNSTIRVLDAMHKKKAPKIQEICPECSHHEAFFTQFQARSADEGTTVMYECCKCQHRRVVNN